jgi:exopolysaccharide biosynthesis protein
MFSAISKRLVVKILIIFLSFIQIVLAGDIQCKYDSVKWNQLEDGVEWVKYDLEFSPYDRDKFEWTNTISRSVTLRMFKIDLRKNRLKFVNFNPAVNCDPAKERYIQKLIQKTDSKIIGAINASFFDMSNSKVLGIAVDEEQIWFSNLNTLNTNSAGILGIKDDRAFMQDKAEFVKEYGPTLNEENAKGIKFAIQAYPKLVRENEVIVSKEVLNSRRSRTAIGYAEDEKVFYLVTIDARGESLNTGMTLYEFGHMLQRPQCGINLKTSLNLDGGGSSAFAIPSLSIFEQADHCRGLGNLLTIQK